MFKTHDNKLSEHELSIGDCLEQLKEIDERLAAVESSSTSGGADGAEAGTGAAAPAGDLNDLINDGAFINGVVDNIMNTTNFASIVDTIIPLKEENEALKQQVEGLNGQVEGLNGQVERLNGKLEEWEERMRQLEDRIRHSTSSSEGVIQEKNTTGCTDVNDEEGEKEEEGEGEGEKEEES
jgi:FtsZ-binding cell division protein ZapB